MAIADEVQRFGAPVRRWARTQKREYTNGEARPLAGDLGAMGVYVGLVSAAAAAVRASGRELPERIPVGDAFLLTVATFRLARRIAKDPVTAPDPGAVHPVRGRRRGTPRSPRRCASTAARSTPSASCSPARSASPSGSAPASCSATSTAPKATRLAALTMTMVAGSDVLQFVYDAIQNGGLAPRPRASTPPD